MGIFVFEEVLEVLNLDEGGDCHYNDCNETIVVDSPFNRVVLFFYLSFCVDQSLKLVF